MSIETHQQVTILIEKLNRDWNRAISRKRLSRIDKDILIEDIRQLYERVYDLKTDLRFEEDAADEPLPEAKMTKEDPVEKHNRETIETEKQEPAGQGNSDLPHEDSVGEDKTSPQKQNPKGNDIGVSGGSETEKPAATEADDLKETERQPAESAQNPDHQNVEKPTLNEPRFTSDKFRASTTLADVYQKNGDNTIVTRIQKNPITDLKSAIGINDKFLFVNEIFKGETVEYMKAIDTLNDMDHYHDAIDYLEKIKEKNKVQNQQATSRLVEIIKRRFQ